LFATTFLSGETPSDFPPRERVIVESIYARWVVIRAYYLTTNAAFFDPTTELWPFSHFVGIDMTTPYVVPEDPRGPRVATLGRYHFTSQRPSDFKKKVLESKLVQDLVVGRLKAAVAASATSAWTPVVKRLAVAERFEEVDLHFTLGTVYVQAQLAAEVICSAGVASVRNVRLTGQLWDLYDWNYSSNGFAALESILQRFAIVQAGYGTLNRRDFAGEIFEIIVDLDEAWSGSEAGPC
jgi:hypothetical protein